MVSLLSLAVLALGALPAMAAPASADVANRVAARQSSGVEVLACDHKDFRPTCFVFYPQLNQCWDMPGELNDKISSVRNLNPSQHTCTWYQHAGCEGEFYRNQNDANLDDGNGWWNDRISSMVCVPDYSGTPW